MPYLALGGLVVVAFLVLATLGMTARAAEPPPPPATVEKPAPLQTHGLSYDQIGAKLRTLAESKANPKPTGAMCYKPVVPHDSAEYVCPRVPFTHAVLEERAAGQAHRARSARGPPSAEVGRRVGSQHRRIRALSRLQTQRRRRTSARADGQIPRRRFSAHARGRRRRRQAHLRVPRGPAGPPRRAWRRDRPQRTPLAAARAARRARHQGPRQVQVDASAADHQVQPPLRRRVSPGSRARRRRRGPASSRAARPSR